MSDIDVRYNGRCATSDELTAIVFSLRKELAAVKNLADAMHSALLVAVGAIGDAIYTEDGLDGETGERVLHVLTEAADHGTFDERELGTIDLLPDRHTVSELRAEIESVTRERDEAIKSSEAWREDAERYCSNADHHRTVAEKLGQAVGLATTCVPNMEIDPDDPVGMMRRMCDEHAKLKADVARLGSMPCSDDAVCRDKTVRELTAEVERLREAVDAKQAHIDALMEEYCPGDMTPEQIENYWKAQRPATPEETARIDANAARKEQA